MEKEKCSGQIKFEILQLVCRCNEDTKEKVSLLLDNLVYIAKMEVLEKIKNIVIL